MKLSFEYLTNKQQAIVRKLEEQKRVYGHGRLNHWILDNGEWIYWFDVRQLVKLEYLTMRWTGRGMQQDAEFELA